MPNLRYEAHHRICNLRYWAFGYEMDAYKGMAKINLHSQSKLIITSVNQF
jgi:hypothetical protein